MAESAQQSTDSGTTLVIPSSIVAALLGITIAVVVSAYNQTHKPDPLSAPASHGQCTRTPNSCIGGYLAVSVSNEMRNVLGQTVYYHIDRSNALDSISPEQVDAYTVRQASFMRPEDPDVRPLERTRHDRASSTAHREPS